MKRFFVLNLVLWSLIFMSPCFSQGEISQEGSKKGSKEGIAKKETKLLGVALGARSNYFRLDHSRKHIVGNLIADEEDQNYTPYPVLQVALSKYFALEFGVNQFKGTTENSDYHRYASDCDVEWMPYMLGLQFRWPHFHKSLVPYLLGGVSYNSVSIHNANWYYFGFPDPWTYNNWTGQGHRPEDWPNNGYRRIHSASDCYGTFLGLGLDFFLTRRWALNLDYRYHWATSDWTYLLKNNNGELSREFGTVVLDSWILGLGVKFFF